MQTDMPKPISRTDVPKPISRPARPSSPLLSILSIAPHCCALLRTLLLRTLLRTALDSSPLLSTPLDCGSPLYLTGRDCCALLLTAPHCSPLLPTAPHCRPLHAWRQGKDMSAEQLQSLVTPVFVCMFPQLCCVCAHARVCVCTYECICILTYAYIHMRISCLRTCAHIYAHTHIHIHIHRCGQ